MPSSHTLRGDAAGAPPVYPGLVKAFLCIDLGLCLIVGLAALAGTTVLLRGAVGDYVWPHVLAETALQYGIATFGLLGNVLLLRRRRGGYWFACVALALTGASMVLSIHGLRLHTAGMETGDAVAFSAGVILVICCRSALNLAYAFALRGAWRSLRAPAGRRHDAPSA